MPIRKASSNYDSDYMSRKCDEDLEQLEERLTALYKRASEDTQAEYDSWISRHEEEYQEMLTKLEAEEITEDEFSSWAERTILRGTRYSSMITHLTDILVNTDVMAMAIVNDELPLVVAESYNFVQSLGFAAADEAGLSVGTFQIYNAESVQILLRDNPDLLPSVDLPVDEKWNRTHINREITQGIVRGESIPKIATRLQSVTNMDRNSAIRNARTTMTGAENMGRVASADRLKSQGIPVDEVWSATRDGRTRDTHILLNGTKRDENGVFGASFLQNPLRYPGDPKGDAEEIYNCRCRLNIVLQGIDHSQDEASYEQFMSENYPEDWAKVKEQRDAKESAYQARARGAAERVEARRR